MLLQLPNGRTVSVSVEQYLAMDDDDIKWMVASGCGSIASSPWCGSAVKKPEKVRVKDEDDDPQVEEGLTEEEKELDDDGPDPVGLDVDGEFDTHEPEE